MILDIYLALLGVFFVFSVAGSLARIATACERRAKAADREATAVEHERAWLTAGDPR